MGWLLVGLSALCLGIAVIVFGIAMKVPPDYQVLLPLTGMLRRRREFLMKTNKRYPQLLEVLRFYTYHLRNLLTRNSMQRLLNKIETRLAMATYPGGLCTEEFVGLICFATTLAAAFGFWFGWEISGRPGLLFPAIFGIPAIGLSFLWVDDRSKLRIRVINRALPYVLDLMTLSLGAGMSFMQALTRVAKDRPEGDYMGDELEYVLHEVAMGKTRREALMAFRDRTDSQYVGEMVSGIVQAEQMGTPLVRTMRVQAAAIRLKRTQRAEKLAGEAPVKMMLPMLFILLAVILTIFGSIIVRAVRGELAT